MDGHESRPQRCTEEPCGDIQQCTYVNEVFYVYQPDGSTSYRSQVSILDASILPQQKMTPGAHEWACRLAARVP